MPMLALIWLGQIEIFSLLGVYLGYQALIRRRPWQISIALLLLAIKPQETTVIIVFLVLNMWKWPLKEWAKVILPACVIVVSTSPAPRRILLAGLLVVIYILALGLKIARAGEVVFVWVPLILAGLCVLTLRVELLSTPVTRTLSS